MKSQQGDPISNSFACDCKIFWLKRQKKRDTPTMGRGVSRWSLRQRSGWGVPSARSSWGLCKSSAYSGDQRM